MNKLDNQPYRGTRDFKPADMRQQNYIFDTWRRVCQSFGYEEYLTPLVEPMELYTAKTSEEIVNEQSYSFTDRGERKLTIRPEMTPSVARMVSQDRLENPYPLRLFSVANYMRYERPQKGRLREFWQLNADLFGDDGRSGDIEIIRLADALMKALGATDEQYVIKVNSRAMLVEFFDKYGLSKSLVDSFIRIMDSRDKIEDGVLYERIENEFSGNPEAKKTFITFIEETEGSDVVETTEAGQNFSDTVQKLLNMNVNVVPDIGLSRGFNYYTDFVFEVFDKNPDNNRSLFGGGRYDALLENFGVEPLPTVGFGMGDAVLAEFLDGHNLWPEFTPSTQVWIINDDQNQEAESVAAELRAKGVNVAIDYSGRKVGKQIKTADTHQIPYVLFVNDGDKHGLKNLKSGEQADLNLEQIVSKLNR